MRRVALSCTALVALSACDVPMDPNAQGGALARGDLEARFAGKTIEMTNTGSVERETGTVRLNANGRATATVGTLVTEREWYIDGQSLCLKAPDVPRRATDCREIRWMQGNRFEVYDTRLGDVKIAVGVIL